MITIYAGFLQFHGVELINNARTRAYANQLSITDVTCECGDLAAALDDTPYLSPDADNAPWWDPAEPHSKDFAGLIGLDITGLSRSLGSRDAVPLVRGGASLHPLRRREREIQVSALALAKTDCALSYGFSWLASALRGGTCTSGCQGDSLCFFTCCPTCPEPVEGDEGNVDCYDANTRHWRTILNVGLLTVDDPDDITQVPGGWLGRITFTFVAGDPYIYRDPTLMVSGPRPEQVLPNYVDPGVPPDCVETADCLQGDCPPPPAPILAPPPLDPCFPSGPFTAARVVMNVPNDRLAIWTEAVPLITIQPGAIPLRRVTIRWYENPLGRDCASDVDPCAACAEVNLNFIPARSTFILDGRTETASVDCPGGPGLRTAEPALYGRGGTPFVWPVFSCNAGACLEIIAQANSVAADLNITVHYVQREDAV